MCLSSATSLCLNKRKEKELNLDCHLSNEDNDINTYKDFIQKESRSKILNMVRNQDLKYSE